MDDMTWMSSFYEPPPCPSAPRPRAPVFWAAAALLAALGCGAVMLAAWPRTPVPAGLAAIHAGPAP